MVTFHGFITSSHGALISFVSFSTFYFFLYTFICKLRFWQRYKFDLNLFSAAFWLMSLTVVVKVSQEEEVSRLAEDCSLADLLHFDDTNNDGQLNLNEFYTAFSKLYSKLSCLPLPVTTSLLPFHHVFLPHHPPLHPFYISYLNAHIFLIFSTISTLFFVVFFFTSDCHLPSKSFHYHQLFHATLPAAHTHPFLLSLLVFQHAPSF